MIKAMKALLNDKRGNVLVLVGFSMPLLVGAAGLATDTVQWSLWKRQLQRAADSAAIAGVYALQKEVSASAAVSNDLLNTQNTGMALNKAAEVTHPTITGYKHVTRVDLEIQNELAFSSFFMTSAPIIRASATAAGRPGGDYCVVSLEDGTTTGIDIGGNADLDLGCGMITNAKSSNNAAEASGSAKVRATPIAAVGGINTTNKAWTDVDDFIPYSTAMDDPFAEVSPAPPSTCSGGANSTKPKKGDTATVKPGCYSSLSFAGQGTTVLEAGTYYVNGGDFSIGSQATVNATAGVTIVLTNTSTSSTAKIGSVNMNAGAELKITAPTTGDFANIAIYQDRRATDSGSGGSANSPNKINGGAATSIEGALYFPSQQVTYNGGAGTNVKCMQLVAKRVAFLGNANMTNKIVDGCPGITFKGSPVVRLIA
ncbi:Tad domain-containing protein [Sphingomicrobium flavum]|uniref:Tad domain-containing protein n=1 Tax=Sphingomicrobium flavum TaxID=1229164 RepID=UPI0021ADF98E|nr:Tad domain-containing protein [Sphingomicrobium flavum]